MESSDKARLKALLPHLVDQIDPIEILPYLTCLSEMARQQIVNRKTQDSSHAAMLLLYEKLIQRTKGFQEFVYGLRQQQQYEGLANSLSPIKEMDKDLQVDDTQSEKDKQHNTSEKMVHQSKPVEKDNTPKQIAHSSPPTKPKRTRMTKHRGQAEYSTLVKDLNAGVQSILENLDYSGEQKWQDLAGHLGYSFSECQKIENDASINKSSPTKVLMNHCTGVTLGDLLEILRHHMDRIDVAERLEQFTGYSLPVEENERESCDPNKDGSNETSKSPSSNGEVSVPHEMKASSANASNEPCIVGGRNDHVVDVEVVYERKPVPHHTERFRNSVTLHNHASNYNPEDLPKPVMRLQTKTVNDNCSSVSGDKLFKSGNSMSAPMRSQLGPTDNQAQPNVYDQNKDSLDTSTGLVYGTATRPYETGTYGTLMQLPHSSGEPRMVKRVQLHQQDSAPPGPYEPITAGTPGIVIPSGPFCQGMDRTMEPISHQRDSPGLIAHPNDTSVHISATGHASDGSDPMLISVGEPLSIHHHRVAQDSLVGFSSSCGETTFSSNEEKAAIQSKAFKPLWKPTDIAVSPGVDSLDNPEEESDAAEFIHALGDLESNGLTKSLFMSDSSMDPSSPVQLISRPGSDLYNRRRSNGSLESMSRVVEGTNDAEEANINTEVQGSVYSTERSMAVGDEVSYDQQAVAKNDVTINANTQEGGFHYSGLKTISHGTITSAEGPATNDAQYSGNVRGEMSFDQPPSYVGDSVNTGVGENISYFPWKSMVVLGTAAVAVTVMFRSLKS